MCGRPLKPGIEITWFSWFSVAKAEPKRVVFAEADNYKILKAAQIVKEEGIAIPILLGKKEIINNEQNYY